MPRERSPNRDKAFEIYKEQKGNITLREIAKILETPEKTISGWKVKDKWDSKLNGVLQTKIRSTPKEKKNSKSKDKEPIAEEVKEVLENTELTDKQRLFCVIYSRCLNATKAYKKAYNCSYETAMVEGCKALRNPKINEQIEKLNAVQFNKEFIKKSLIQKYLDIAFADISDYVSFGRKEIEVAKDKDDKPVMIEVNYVDFKNSNEVDGTIISEISQGKDGVKIKLQDKMKAMDFLAKNIGLLDIATQQKLEIEQRKMALLEKQADDLDEDIEYVVEEEKDVEEEKEN